MQQGGVDPAQIEQIVREVLRRLANKPEADPTRREVTWPKRLVTLADAQDKLAGCTSLVMPARGVVTPAAKDWLRQQGVTLSYSGAESTASKPKKTLVCQAAETRFDSTALLEGLRRDNIGLEVASQTELTRAAAEMAERLARGGRLGLLLTDQPVAGLCLANRQRGLRAITSSKAGEVTEAARSVGANLLVLNPAGWSGFELKQCVARFVAAGPYACPERLRPWLE